MFGIKPPQSIFVQADGFLKVAMMSNKQPDDPHFDPFIAAAGVTNSAFASELYLKCLIQIDTGMIIKDGHDLFVLFRKLPEKTQQEIEEPFNAELAKAPKYDLSKASPDAMKVVATLPKTLREALKAGGRAFIEWRYLYENDNTNHFSLFSLPPILRRVILTRRPEWANFGINLRRIGNVLPTSPAQKTPTQSAPGSRPGAGSQ